MSPKLSLEHYTEEVNRLLKKSVDAVNADPNLLFGSAYAPISEKTASFYYSRGYDVNECFNVFWKTKDNTPL